MKSCIKCKAEKPLTDFYSHKEMSDGRVNKCKECEKIESKNIYHSSMQNSVFIEKERKRAREKNKNRNYIIADKYKESIKIMRKNYKIKFPEKIAATYKSQGLKKPFDFAQKHHWSYNASDALDVIWLSKYEHAKAHRYLVYDRETFMYRRYDTGEILDTKQKHERFIRDCIIHKED